jgi:hypothetical protein
MTCAVCRDKAKSIAVDELVKLSQVLHMEGMRSMLSADRGGPAAGVLAMQGRTLQSSAKRLFELSQKL